MGQTHKTFLSSQPLPTGRLWTTLVLAWLAAIAAVWLQQNLLAGLLASAGLALVVTAGLGPIRRAFVREQSKLTALLNAAPEGILEIDPDGRIVFANPALCELFGYGPGELLGLPVEVLVPQAYRHAHVAHRTEFRHSSRSRPMGSGLDIQGVRRDGSLVPIDIGLNRIQTSRGTAMYCTVRDMSVRKAFETQLIDSNRRLTESVATLERHSFELRTLTEMGELLHSSNTEAELYGIVGHTMERLFPGFTGALYTLADSRTSAGRVCTWGTGAAGLPQEISCQDCWTLRRGRPHGGTDLSGHLRCAHLGEHAGDSGQCIPLLGHGELMGLLHFVVGGSEQAGELCAPARLQLLHALANQIALSLANLRLRETLRLQSTIDPLTGLHNRRVLDGYFNVGIRTALEQQRPVALLMLDIDHFKSFNDCLGHDCGDLALREVGNLLRRSVRHDDIVCRMGGEEFAIVLPDANLQDAERTAEQLRSLVEGLRLQHDGRMLMPITVSVGVAVLDLREDTASSLLRRADRALYRAKAAGRNRVIVGGQADETGPQRRLSILRGHA